MRVLTYTCFYLLSILMISCKVLPSYRSVNIEANMQPAKIQVSNDFKDSELLIVDRTEDAKDNLDNILVRDKIAFANSVAESFKNEILARKQYDINSDVKKTKSNVTGTFPSEMNKQIAKSLTFGNRLIASIEYININQEDNFYQDWESTYDVNNILINRRSIIIGNKNIKTESGWRLYDTSGRVIDEFVINKDYSFEVKSNNRSSADFKLQNELNKAYKNIAKNVGFVYADRISEYKSYVSRNYYIRSRTSSLFEIAMDYIDDNDWESATGVWYEIIDMRQNERDVAKAYFNLGVYYEKSKKIDKAIDNVRISAATDNEIGDLYLSALIQVKENGY
jgi:tetratricopeptide (TPR) repeat protein